MACIACKYLYVEVEEEEEEEELLLSLLLGTGMYWSYSTLQFFVFFIDR